MSEKGKARRARYQERQAKQGVRVFGWVIGLLALLAILSLVVFISQG